MTTPAPARAAFSSRQLFIVGVIAAVQFVNILDFVMVMPLGPSFASALRFSEAQVGYVAGAYTAAAAVSGLWGSVYLDRFDRRRALLLALLGLAASTAAGALAWNLSSLIAARVLAGAFGGPATSTAIAIVSDTVPSQLRGKAMGLVMGAFSVASVFGVPIGLWFAELYGWRAPFVGTAALGLVVAVAAAYSLPAMSAHLERATEPAGVLELLRRPVVVVTYCMTAAAMMAGFILIPNVSGFLQLNLGVSLSELKTLYLVGGLASFASMQAAGFLVDRFGSFRTSLLGVPMVVAVLWAGFVAHPPALSPVVLFAALMVGMGLRNVSNSTLSTKVPEPAVRARYQSLSSSVQHGASALASAASTQLLTKVPVGGTVAAHAAYALRGIDHIAWIAIALNLLLPGLLWWIEGRVDPSRRRAVRPPQEPR